MTDDKQFRELMESVNTGIIVIQDEKIVYVNSYLSERFGAPKSKLINKPFFEFIPTSNLKQIKKQYSDIVSSTKRIKYFVTRIVNAKGYIRTVKLNAASTKFNDKPARIISLQDITAQKEAQESFIQSEERFRSILENIHLISIMLDKDANIIFVNDYLLMKTGWKRNEVLGKNWFDTFIDPSINKEIKQVFKDTIKEDNFTPTYINEILTKNGDNLLVKWSNTTIYDNNKNPIGITSIGEDITLQNKSERELIEQKSFQESLINASSDIIYIFDIEKNVNVFSNDSIGTVLGYSISEIQSKSNIIQDLMHPEDFANYLENIIPHYKKAKDNELIEHEYRMRHKNGNWCWLLSKESVYKRNDKGIVTQIFGLISEITDRKQAELKLRESEEKYRTLIENIGEFTLIYTVDFEGNINYVSPAITTKMGYDAEEFLGNSYLNNLTTDEQREKEIVLNEKYTKKRKPIPRHDLEFFSKDRKKRFWLEIVENVINDHNGNIIGIQGIARDITDRKNFENRLLTEKNYSVQLVNSLPGLFYEISPNGKFTNWNTNFKNKVGYNSREMGEINPTDLFEGEEKKYIADRINEVFKTGHSTAEANLISKKGKRTPYIFTGTRIEVDGEPRLIGMGIDISEQKEQDKKIIESENKFRSNLENINLLAIMLDSNGKIGFVNDHLLKKTGWKRKEVLGKNYFDVFISKGVRQRSKRRFKEIIASKSTYTNRINELLTKNGEQLIIDWNVTTQYDGNDNLIAATSIGNDITEKIKNEKDLKFQSDLIKQSYESIITTDLNFKISWTNEAFTKLFGYSRKEVIGKTPNFLNAEPLSKDIQNIIYEKVSDGKLYQNTLLNVRKDGSKFYCQMSIFPIYDDKNKIIAYSGHQLDITDEINAQQALAISEERYRDLFEHQLEAYAYHEIILNKKGEPVNYKFIDVNDQFLRELNIKKKSDVIGISLLELDPNIDKKWVKHYGEVALTGKPKKFEDQFAQNGKWYKIYAYSPKIGYFATSFIDISDEKKAEKELNKYKDHLEEIVDKRTAELKRKNAELDNALKVFVGRELTIKNLHSQINKLEKELKKLKKGNN